MSAQLLLGPEVRRRLGGISWATLRRMVLRGDFPPPVKLSRKLIGWTESTVDEWIASRQTAQP